jgi:mono/diheme cytochrome c family protein
MCVAKKKAAPFVRHRAQESVKEVNMKIKGIGLAVALVALGAAALSEVPQAARGDAYVVKGQKLYAKYCASCHGTQAKGDGPVAASLKTRPPDLTAIQQKGEKFPFDKVAVAIDGEKTDRAEAHGTNQMPVWGTIFRRTSSAAEKEGDVYALTRYIASIQTAK